MYKLQITGLRTYGPIPGLFRPDTYKINYNGDIMTIAELVEKKYLVECMGDISIYDDSRYIIFIQTGETYEINYDGAREYFVMVGGMIVESGENKPYIGIFDKRSINETLNIEIGSYSPNKWFIVYTAYFEDENGHTVPLNKYKDKRPDIIWY